MSFFSKHTQTDRYGVLIDIGSGSVMVAIVHSSSGQKHPHIVWSQREHAPLKNINSMEQSAKAVLTALMNATLQIDTEGRKVLNLYNPQARITSVQATISAPWSYTVTKSIRYTQEEEFTITDELCTELVTTIEDKIASELAANETVNDLGLRIITQSTMDALSNGYRVQKPQGQKALEFSLSRANVIAQEYLANSLDEICEKLFASSDCRKLSFMLMMYSVVRDLLPYVYEVCLVDITYEATEIGIIRDGSLQYCTHTSFGSFSIAREIAAALNVPLHEAFGYLHAEDPLYFIKTLSEKQQKDVEKIFEAYTEKIHQLFHETGDALSIPKHIAIHSDAKSEVFFIQMIEKAAKRSLKTSPIITQVSKQILTQLYDTTSGESFMNSHTDSALLLSALFFHTHHDSSSFVYV